MTPAQLYDRIESNLWGLLVDGTAPWRAGAGVAAKRLGLDSAMALDGVLETKALFARAVQEADPRVFRLPAAAERAQAPPVLVLPPQAGGSEADDLVAFSLAPSSRRIWRVTCACTWLGVQRTDTASTLRIFQDPHAWLASTLKAAAYRRRGREERVAALEEGHAAAQRRAGLPGFAAAVALAADDARRVTLLRGYQAAMRQAAEVEERWRIPGLGPDGTLILDPVAIDWTRRGALGDVEAVEIVDAPISGPLGRALMRLNPRFNSARGVRLVGQAEARPLRRSAA